MRKRQYFIPGEGGVKANFEFHCFATHFTSISCSSETAEGRGKSVHLLKALFKTNSEVNGIKAMAIGLLKIFGTRDSTSRQMQRNECSLKVNIFFYLRADL